MGQDLINASSVNISRLHLNPLWDKRQSMHYLSAYPVYTLTLYGTRFNKCIICQHIPPTLKPFMGLETINALSVSISRLHFNPFLGQETINALSVNISRLHFNPLWDKRQSMHYLSANPVYTLTLYGTRDNQCIICQHIPSTL